MELNECINFMLTRAQNIVFLYFKDKLAQFDVTPVQYAILKCLWDNGEQYPSQLAQMLYLDASTITGILSRLERKKLIERIHSDKDRRAVSIKIKPAGLALRKGIENTIREANEEALALITQEQFQGFKTSLENIMQSVENIQAEKREASGK